MIIKIFSRMIENEYKTPERTKIVNSTLYFNRSKPNIKLNYLSSKKGSHSPTW